MTIVASEFAGPVYAEVETSEDEEPPEEKKVVEKKVNKKLGDGLAAVLMDLGDDNPDAFNDDCKYWLQITYM